MFGHGAGAESSCARSMATSCGDGWRLPATITPSSTTPCVSCPAPLHPARAASTDTTLSRHWICGLATRTKKILNDITPENKSSHNLVQDIASYPVHMFDEYFVFSLCFFVLSYKVLFWSERSVSFGVLLLTSSCALAMTHLVYPHTHAVMLNAFSKLTHNLPPQATPFNEWWTKYASYIPFSPNLFSFSRQR